MQDARKSVDTVIGTDMHRNAKCLSKSALGVEKKCQEAHLKNMSCGSNFIHLTNYLWTPKSKTLLRVTVYIQ